MPTFQVFGFPGDVKADEITPLLDPYEAKIVDGPKPSRNRDKKPDGHAFVKVEVPDDKAAAAAKDLNGKEFRGGNKLKIPPKQLPATTSDETQKEENQKEEKKSNDKHEALRHTLEALGLGALSAPLLGLAAVVADKKLEDKAAKVVKKNEHLEALDTGKPTSLLAPKAKDLLQGRTVMNPDPAGEHLVTMWATDDCGNPIACKFTFEVNRVLEYKLTGTGEWQRLTPSTEFETLATRDLDLEIVVKLINPNDFHIVLRPIPVDRHNIAVERALIIPIREPRRPR